MLTENQKRQLKINIRTILTEFHEIQTDWERTGKIDTDELLEVAVEMEKTLKWVSSILFRRR